MNIEIAIVVGLVFAAASLGRFAYERHMDVLYGPYIEGGDTQPVLRIIVLPVLTMIDHVRSRLRGMACPASIAAR